MDHEVERGGVVREDTTHRVEVADVDGKRPEGLGICGHQAFGLACRGRGRPEIVRPHVVLETDHVEAGFDEVRDGLGADETA